MKKILSLVLVMCLMLAMAPAAFAAGHLDNCPGPWKCRCEAVLAGAEKEEQELKAFEALRVWLLCQRDEAGERLDTIVAEVELPYFYTEEVENQAFLDENEAVKEVLLGYFEEDELAENLYRSAGFIHTQIGCSFDYLGSSAALEYRLVGADSAEKVILSCPALDKDVESITVRVGDILVKLPEACHNQAFILAMSIAEDSAEIELMDESGAAIEGAEIVK